MKNDVSRALNRWKELLTCKRMSGSYENGRFVFDVDKQLSFQGVVQVAGADDLKVLPEGTRTEEAIKVHTVFPLNSATKTGESDIVIYKSQEWKVYNVSRAFIGNYYKAICKRI